MTAPTREEVAGRLAGEMMAVADLCRDDEPDLVDLLERAATMLRALLEAVETAQWQRDEEGRRADAIMEKCVAARADALEEAAKVAAQWLMDQRRSKTADTVRITQDIAAAIRGMGK